MGTVRLVSIPDFWSKNWPTERLSVQRIQPTQCSCLGSSHNTDNRMCSFNNMVLVEFIDTDPPRVPSYELVVWPEAVVFDPLGAILQANKDTFGYIEQFGAGPHMVLRDGPDMSMPCRCRAQHVGGDHDMFCPRGATVSLRVRPLRVAHNPQKTWKRLFAREFEFE